MLTDMMKDELVKGLLNLFHENLSMIILYGLLQEMKLHQKVI